MSENEIGSPGSSFHATWDPKNTFTGTARYYARYRPGYPPGLIRTLGERFALDKDSRVIDLGCGTGQIAIKLAPKVGKIIAIDPQEEMLEEGQKKAARRKITNISWLTGESANLLSLVKSVDKVDLTVIARAFHWMDRIKVLEDIYRLTRLGGGIAVVIDNGPLDIQDTTWQAVLKDTVIKWLGEERRAGTTGTYTHPRRRHQEIIRESAFKDITIVNLKTVRTWSMDRIIGYIYSTSYVSIPILGDKKESFEADLRRRLAGLDPGGRFRERVIYQIIMAWKR
jgi:ubiquinone/menaquinone biosynthesis C-methylase UbiE